jgi:N-acetylmuramic acid 6-phosphate etherase
VNLANEKLWERARRMVESLAGCDATTALRALESARDVRAATLMVRFGLSAEAAAQRLDAAGGSLRAALETTDE